ncbi:MAG TPA: oligosaccharide flippase family protein [Pyrinomonadaceae bacterium]|jgi:O-antigen/teichoic acid export membrane protein|nr:oligosaccharide flippase family protein [Pyrinomonadaceae bacterium]
MSRTNRFLSGVSFGYASQILTTFVAFWLTPFLLHRIGQHSYGLWLVGAQLVFYLGLLDVGIVALLPRETAYATGRAPSLEETSDLPLLIGQTLRVIVYQVPLVALGAAILWFSMPAEWLELKSPIGVVLIAFVLIFPLRVFNAILNGLQDLAFLGRMTIVGYLLSTCITIGLVMAGWGLYALALGWAVSQIFGAVTGWYRLWTRFPFVLPRSLPRISWQVARHRLGQGFWVSLNQIAQVLLNGTDILIIGKVFGPAAVVPYAITGKLIGVLANQPQMLMAAAGPALSQMRTGESHAHLSRVCIALSQAMLMLSGAVVCVVLAVNEGFVGRWVGSAQYGGFALTGLILLSMLLRHWNLTVGYALFCFGYERRLCLTALGDGLLSVVAVFLLTRELGIIGAPLGIIIGAVLISLPANLSALAHESKVSLGYLIQPLLPWFVRFLLIVAVAGVIAKVWIPNTLVLIGIVSIAIGIVYCLVMLPLAFREPLGSYVRPLIYPLRAQLFRFFRPGAKVTEGETS